MKSKHLILLVIGTVLVGACSNPIAEQNANLATDHFDPKGKAPSLKPSRNGKH
jgi:hypothetical protein